MASDRRTNAVMLQGTGSDVGKSLLAAGLCRAFTRRGLKVAPFKPQNMSNNAAVTADGGEIGRAQALQARACGLAPRSDMNPVLLKPHGEAGSQVVVQGRVWGSASAREYQALKPELLGAVLESYRRLAAGVDLVIVEGAGSAAEVNLRAADIANMGFAEAADLPVLLVGDIDRGGVIASLVGTHVLLPETERRRVAGYLINKFRGDAGLFTPALDTIRDHTGWDCLGVVPWFADAHRLPAEDAVALDKPRAANGAAQIRIAVPRLSRIANFDDFDPLAAEPDVSLTFVSPGRALPEADLVILPGSKATIADLIQLRSQGWDYDLMVHLRRGGRVLGICAGYQMLGRVVRDPLGLEGPPGEAAGLGLLDVETALSPDKTLTLRQGRDATGTALRAYEMHMGVTSGADADRPMLTVDGVAEGAQSLDGRVAGCYLHGLFASDPWRRGFLETLRPGRDAGVVYEMMVEDTLDRLADHLERYVDMERVLRVANNGAPASKRAMGG